MMEVKQNTTMDLNQIKSSNITDNEDIIEDTVVNKTNLLATDVTSKNGDLNGKNNEQLPDIDLDVEMEDLGSGTAEPISAEMEDALLDDVEDNSIELKRDGKIQTVDTISNSNIEAENKSDVPTIESNLVEDKASSGKQRDVGDDLDTLLSKINDIVEECAETAGQTPSEHEMVTEQKEVEEQKLSQSTETAENNAEESEKMNVDTNDFVSNVVEEEEFKQSTDTTVDTAELSSESTAELNQTTGSAENVTKSTEKTISETSAEHESDLKETSAKTEETPTIKDSELAQEENTIKSSATVDEDQSNQNLNDSTIPETTGDSEDDDVTAIEHEIPTLTVDDEDEDENAETVDKQTEIVKPAVDVEKTANVPDEQSKEPAQAEEDSDDDVVFFLDNEPSNDKPAKESTENAVTAAEESTANNNEEDYDVVLLDDDDDESKPAAEEKKLSADESNSKIDASETVEPAETTSQENSKEAEEVKQPNQSSIATEKQKELDLLADNSDNARDDFASSEEQIKTVDKELASKEAPSDKIAAEADETTSNCSSSSNLLQEAKPSSLPAEEEHQEEEEEDAEAAEDAEEVEVIDDLVVETPSVQTDQDKPDTKELAKDSEAAPPAKRIRLSTEEVDKSAEVVDKSSQELGDKTEVPESTNQTETNIDKSSASGGVKRSHNEIEVDEPQKVEAAEEISHKKPKTEEPETDVASNINAETCDTQKEVKQEAATEIKEEVKIEYKPKAIGSNEPIPLYPAPKFEEKVVPFSIDFLKRFHKSCSNMTKADLEELALQKIVEAIVHKSEFAEMRELIEKQEKIINSHRMRITELSKQFRDLEMVHNRVIRDIEQKNSQFIMPVKITRAVGLQVYIPNKKGQMPEAMGAATANPANRPAAPRITAQTSPIRSQPLPTTSSIADSTVNRLAAAGPLPTSQGINGRKKITPQRPIDAAAYRNTQAMPANASIMQNAGSKVLHKNISSSPAMASQQRRSFPGSTNVPSQPPTTGRPLVNQSSSMTNAM